MSNIDLDIIDYPSGTARIEDDIFDINHDFFNVKDINESASFFKITGEKKNDPQRYTVTFYSDSSGSVSSKVFKVIFYVVPGQSIDHIAGGPGILPLDDLKKYFIVPNPPVCFLPGTLIETEAGNKFIENLFIGDVIISFVNNKSVEQKVIWSGNSHCVVRVGLPADIAGYPIRILEDAISKGVPFEDLLVTSEHCLFIDGGFVPARMLVNGRTIFYDKSITRYDYYHVETEKHSVIKANGVFTESYLDTGNRHLFRQKGSVISIARSRNLSWEHDAIAPLTVSREVVEPIFRRLERRAIQKLYPPQIPSQSLTEERNLYLLTENGKIIHQIRENNNYVVFMIPAGVENIHILSNSSRPSDVIGAFVDDRRNLGILVGDIFLFEAEKTILLKTHLEDKNINGWNNVEDGSFRWTDGNAFLHLGKRPNNSLAIMAIHIKASGPYVVEREEDIKDVQGGIEERLIG